MSNTNMNVHSLEFWEKVKSKYKKSTSYLLCSVKLFEEKWKRRSYDKEEIRSLAQNYLKDTGKSGGVGCLFLFYSAKS